MPEFDLAALSAALDRVPMYRRAGRVRGAQGLLTCSVQAALGDHCEILTARGKPVLAEVIGFSDQLAYLVPYDVIENVEPGMTVIPRGHGLMVPTGPALLGRVLDGLGRPLDNKGELTGCAWRPLQRSAPPALERARIRHPFVTGVRAVDGLLTCGQGQRVGIFAGSGVGKSTLLGEIAKGAVSDINVIALIGERGREVGPFLEDCLGEDGMKRSIVVVATCEQSPLMRVRAAQAAITMADWFRDQGLNVLFMLDSLTRLAMAQREMGLALGEPPSARGYTPSVFQLLANVVERLGNGAAGSITGLLTVLVDGDDTDEPISDSVRSFVDGHIVLDRALAEKGHYPAINIGRSVSRIAPDVSGPDHQQAARKLRAILATHTEAHDLLRIGAYARGSSPQIDKSVELLPAVEQFLKQDVGHRSRFDDTKAALVRLASAWPF
jgi:flagellum-specific ATP synthase